MEHFKSTFAATGIAVLGLMAAAGILHPGNFERQAQPAAKSHAVAAAPTAWVDPPASRSVALRRAAPLSDTAALMKPEPTIVLSADYAMVQPLSAELTLVATTARSARTSQAPKMARHATTRQAALIRPAANEASAVQQPSIADSSSQKIDPIGDLLRGLGLTDKS
ncbi:hypothetical protein GCM10007886_26240 [Methylobacterium gregans]|uniref:Uncharacterized protein n=2 Tax=Methylobacterium gregans TaxID=374424 RepID=A0AA37HN35_9HYPH|nr:hypothetical protein [Methylobacterium gregans]GJD78470.1 hypothetical protein NBEOAGPD_1685 [Methylobacterium gregans]GLS54441.1 hypothetical protein GCM10007886_26240 [Methylobacterium gregans]